MDDDHTKEENWLRRAVFPCPGCGVALYRVDHSPFYDEYFLYCDSCANSVQVDWYDAVTRAIDATLASHDAPDPGWERERAKLRLIEDHLRPCGCGGRYRHDAPRRCPYCQRVVIADETGVDLWPGYFWYEEDRDPTPEQTERAEAYFARHVQKRDIWRDGEK